MKYPNPCDTCEKTDCADYRKCQPYKQRVNAIWKQFNGYPARVYRAQKPITRTKFAYEHPDIICRYLAKGPCENCRRAEVCDTPCVAYWRWWDARQEWHRRRLRAGKEERG